MHPNNKKAKRWEGLNCQNPEERLLCAIIERAILDLYSPDFREKKKAANWLLSNNCDKWSFKWVIEKLNLSGNILKKIEKIIIESLQ